MTADRIEPVEGRTPRFGLVFGRAEEGRLLRQLIPTIKGVLSLHHGNLPSDTRVTIAGEALQASLSSRKGHSISATSAVLASAAISGREPAAATTIIGVIDRTGAFNLPSDFWDQLRSLDRGQGGRLVLPAAAAEYLPSLLALEEPLFFLKYEVLLASSFEELIERSAKTSDRPLTDASAKFLELGAKLEDQAITQYLSNAFVRRRLEEILEMAPFHQSAAMLAVQGAGERPTSVVRPVMIGEIRRALEALEWLVAYGDDPFAALDQDRLSASSATCRDHLESLVRSCSKEDRRLLRSAQSLMSPLRTLERAVKSREAMVFSAHSEFMRDYRSLLSALAAAETEPRRRR